MKIEDYRDGRRTLCQFISHNSVTTILGRWMMRTNGLAAFSVISKNVVLILLVVSQNKKIRITRSLTLTFRLSREQFLANRSSSSVHTISGFIWHEIVSPNLSPFRYRYKLKFGPLSHLIHSKPSPANATPGPVRW